MTETPFGVLLGEQARARPGYPALTCDGVTITRGELDARTNRLARAYRALGVTPDSFVTIGLPNGIAFFEAMVATWKLGATPQPISSRLPPAERRAIVELAHPSLVVGVDPSESAGRPTVPAGFEPDGSLSADPLPPAVATSFKAPTSGGSTGRPKLIVATQRAVWEALADYTTLLRMTTDGVHLVTGPLYHNGPFTSSGLALLRGNHVVVMPRFDASTALMLIERHRVDWMYAVPTMMHRIWRLPEGERTRFDLSSLRVVFHMAAPCPIWLKEAWIRWLGGERFQPGDDGVDREVGRRCSGRDADAFVASEPFRIDLFRVFDMVSLDAALASDVGEVTRVGALAATDDDHQIHFLGEVNGRRLLRRGRVTEGVHDPELGDPVHVDLQ